MNRIRRILGVLAGLATAAASFAAAPAAFAVTLPPGGGGVPVQPAGVRTVVAGGMPGWQIAMIAAGAALLAAAVAVLLDRGWSARRRALAPTT
jgi:hypothetical protein